MSTDYGEKERQFLETLKADTGRALEDWMAAIASEGLTHRNDIIDWLRRQGFMFSKASWLERIHNNGGRPIYAGKERPQARPRTAPLAPRLRAVPQDIAREAQVGAPPTEATPPTAVAPSMPTPQAAPPPAPLSSPASLSSNAPTRTAPAPAAASADPAALDALVAKGKAFRPLAVYVIAEIRKAVPGAEVLALDNTVAFRLAGRDFALLAVSAKELRLGLALAASPPGVPMTATKLAVRGANPMDQVITLTDARQITPDLLAAVAKAAASG